MRATREPRRVHVVHGFDSAPENNWFPWLRERLSADGVEVTAVRLPDAAHPDRRAWEAALADSLGGGVDGGGGVGGVDERTSIVAHSLGCITTLRYLASLPGEWRLRRLVMVAGFLEPLPALPELDGYLAGGAETRGLAGHIGRVAVLASDDDPTVPAAHTRHLARALGTVPTIVKGVGHFTTDDGVTALPEVLDLL